MYIVAHYLHSYFEFMQFYNLRSILFPFYQNNFWQMTNI